MNNGSLRKEYHIAFYTNASSTVQPSAPIPMGYLKSVKVTIEYDMLPPEKGDMAEKYDVSLVEHPLFPDLERYVLANGLRKCIPTVKDVRKAPALNPKLVVIEFDRIPTLDQVEALREALVKKS